MGTPNEVYKPASVQFAIRSIERLHLSNFVDFREPPCPPVVPPDPIDPLNNGLTSRLWPNVYQELVQIYPALPSNAWTDQSEKGNQLWLTAAETLYGKPEELVVFLTTHTGCKGGYWAHFPAVGRQVMMNGANLAGEPYKLPHELGHYFGLVHTHEDDTWRDPDTNTPHVKSDRWDLYFKPGDSGTNPNVFYNSKAAAAADEAALRRIEIRTAYDAGADAAPIKVNTCVVMDASTNYTTCVLGGATQGPDGGIPGYKETYSTGAAQLKGMAFTFGAGTGLDVMSYLGKNETIHSRTLNHTNVELVRRYLRFDYQLDSDKAALIKPSTTMSGRRPQLGSWDVRSPNTKLDFDGDGKRDFGVWIPPTTLGPYGQFVVLLSAWGYSTTAGQKIDVQFGKLGDIPVPADYNGDGKTDVAVFQPGGGSSRGNVLDTTGYWRWCPTAAAPSTTVCGHDGTAPSPVAWGYRDSVPLPGLDFDGDATDTELAHYRPSTGAWEWLDIGVGSSTRQLGPAGSVPLPGLYDGDSKTDIAVYIPALAQFQLLRSQQNWNTVTTRAFGSQFIPLPTGTSAERSAPFPIAGMTHPQVVGGVTVPRRSFTLFDPTGGGQPGTWNTMWDPVSGGAIDSCGWGVAGLDVPLAGIDRNGDNYSDYAVYRGKDVASGGVLRLKLSSPGACTGVDVWRTYATPNQIRTRAAAVADMSGDGKADILFIQPDAMTVYWAVSDDDFQTIQGPRTFGNQRAVFF